MAAALVLASCGGGGNDNASQGSAGDTGSPGASSSGESQPASTGDSNASAIKIYQDARDYTARVEAEIQAGATSSKDTLTFGCVADPGKISLDNLLDDTQKVMATAAVEYFTRYDFTKEAYYSPVCDSMEADADGMGVTFHITPDIKMNDGNTFEASDLVTSIKAFREHSGLGWQLDFVDLDKTEIIDPYTIDVRFNMVNGVWETSFEMLTLVSGKAYDAVNGDESFYQAPIGPQAYDVTEWVSGDHITFTRFDDYYMGTPPIKTIVCKMISDQTAGFMALQNGDIDLFWSLSSDQVRTLYASEDHELMSAGQNWMIYMGMNCANEALSDMRVREAIVLTVNRQDIIDGAYDGLSSPSYSIFTPESIGYDKGWETNSLYPDVDVEKAKQLLADAGYADGLTLRILGQSTTSFQLMVEQLSAQLSQIGITLDPMLADYATVSGIIFSGDTAGYDIFLGSVEDCGDSIATIDNPMLFGASHPELSSDGSGDELMALYGQIRGTTDIAGREKLYQDLNAFFFEKGFYWIPMSVAQSYVAVDKDLTGMRLNGFLIYFEGAYYR